ncbi:MAG TPA: SCO family protein [Geobacteraceae bacterium]
MIKKKILFRILTVFLAACCVGRAGAADKDRRISAASYTVPDVVLVNQDGAKVRLKSYIETNQPVVLDFVYATCTTICPILSAGFASLQNRLGPDARKARLVSITIDPEHDTPKVMKEYLKRYHAKPGWDFLTGTREDIDRVMRAFDAYVPDKMLHHQLTLIRSPRDGRWTRIKGLVSGAELLEEYAKASKR